VQIIRPYHEFPLLALGLSICVGLAVVICWLFGWFAPLQQAFMLDPHLVRMPSAFDGSLLIMGAVLVACLAMDRLKAHWAWLTVGGSLAVWCVSSLLMSKLAKLDIMFAPGGLAFFGSALVAQVKHLWFIDRQLTERIENTMQFHQLESTSAGERWMSGLKLLATVLPLDEAVIFRRDEYGQLTPAARLRARSQTAPENNANALWREGVRLCEAAIATKELLPAAAKNSPQGAIANVAVPLFHQGRSVGALLLRQTQPFDEADRPLLAAVGAQMARDFQRDEVRRQSDFSGRWSFYSPRAAERRVAAFDVVSGLLTEHRFTTHALAASTDGYAVAFLDGTLAYANDVFLRYARLTAKDAFKCSLFELLNRFRTVVFDDPSLAVRRVLQTGEPYERELETDGRKDTLALRIALVREPARAAGDPGEPLSLVISIRDVSRLKEHAKLKSDMVSLMAHEFRTPITSISGFAELLAMDERIPEDAREFLNIICNESQRLTKMVGTFLAVSKLEASDKQEVIKAPIRLDEVVAEALDSFQSEAKRKRIRLANETPARVPPVAADKMLITQVVFNLVDNAIRYSPERTTVTVTTRLELDAVRVEVEDRGFGIPTGALDRVWEKFYRVTQEGQIKDDKSTGLGLAFVKEVVEQHGGAVSVESQVGHGSKFSFTLPRL
jgi:signal transduction histidine kinase